MQVGGVVYKPARMLQKYVLLCQATTVVVAGLKIDNVKVSAPAGERRPLTITYTAPQLRPGSIAAMGLNETVVRTITGILKGGVPPPKAAAGRRIHLNIHCTLCKST